MTSSFHKAAIVRALESPLTTKDVKGRTKSQSTTTPATNPEPTKLFARRVQELARPAKRRKLSAPPLATSTSKTQVDKTASRLVSTSFLDLPQKLRRTILSKFFDRLKMSSNSIRFLPRNPSHPSFEAQDNFKDDGNDRECTHPEEFYELEKDRTNTMKAAQVLSQVHVDIVDDVEHVKVEWLKNNVALHEKYQVLSDGYYDEVRPRGSSFMCRKWFPVKEVVGFEFEQSEEHEG